MLVFNYIKLLLKKWYVYLSFIPVVQGFSASYFDAKIYLQQNLLWGFALISVFIACYNVWLDQKKENVRLQKSIKEHENKFSDFKITAVLKKIYVEDDFSSSLIQRKRKQVKDKLEKLEVEINKFSTVDNKISVNSLNFPRFYDVHSELDDIRLNKEQLIQYKNALNDYLDNVIGYQKEIQCLINEKIKDCYFLVFNMKNNSQIFDENIDLSVTIGAENSFLDNKYLSDFLSRYLDIPKRKSFGNVRGNSISFSNDSFLRFASLNNQDIDAFYKRFELSEHKFSLNVKELKANESVQVTRKAFVAKLNNIDSLQYAVLSKCSGKKITGDIVLDMDNKIISYEEVVMNKEINCFECED